MLCLLFLLLAAAAYAPAVADTPGGDWLSRQHLTQMLAMRGFTATELEADDGHWEGELSKGGRSYEFHADPKTGYLSKIEIKH